VEEHVVNHVRAALSIAAAAGIFAIGAAGCGNDASVDTRDKGAAKAIINMPDHFPNVAFKCRGSKGIYVTNNTSSGSGSPAVIPNDPECRQTR
jgi:hypothetical protein